jgi:hypothetical protein
MCLIDKCINGFHKFKCIRTSFRVSHKLHWLPLLGFNIMAVKKKIIPITGLGGI